MIPPAFQPLCSILDREAVLQNAIAKELDNAIAAAQTRDLAALDAALQQFDDSTRRARAFASERESLVQRMAATLQSGKTLRAIAEAPGAPSAELLKRRELLIPLATRVDEQSRRLLRLVRELGDIYESAVNAILNDHRTNVIGANHNTGAQAHSGSFMNIEV
ncbi:MAG: hypothetical protein ACKVS6_13600 [Planctomycetota bacterium]